MCIQHEYWFEQVSWEQQDFYISGSFQSRKTKKYIYQKHLTYCTSEINLDGRFFIAVAVHHNLTEMESIGIFSGSVWACAGLAEAYAAGPTLKSFEMLGRPGKIICKTIDWGVMVVVAIFKSLAQTYQRQENREQYQTMPHLKVSKLVILTKWGRSLFEFWTLSKDTQSLICNLTAKLSKQHGIGPECIRLLSRKAAMIITPSLPLKTHPKEHNKHEDLEEGAEDMRVTAQK